MKLNKQEFIMEESFPDFHPPFLQELLKNKHLTFHPNLYFAKCIYLLYRSSLCQNVERHQADLQDKWKTAWILISWLL